MFDSRALVAAIQCIKSSNRKGLGNQSFLGGLSSAVISISKYASGFCLLNKQTLSTLLPVGKNDIDFFLIGIPVKSHIYFVL